MNYFVQFLIVFDLICFGVYFGGDIVCTALAKVRKKPGQKDPYEFEVEDEPAEPPLSIDAIRHLFRGEVRDFVCNKLLPSGQETLSALTEPEQTAARCLFLSLIHIWLKEMLVGGIMGNLTGMFDSVNQQGADIATQVGQTPQGWNGSIFSMIQNLSNSIMVPIAGVILAIVMTLELIQMITDRNNLHDVDTWMIFKWVFKSAAAILLVTNTWNLVMAVFDMAQSVVAQASGIIGSDASIDISAVMTDMEDVYKRQGYPGRPENRLVLDYERHGR